MNVQDRARSRWDSVAKPLHSLGLLENLVVQIAGVQGTEDVCIDRRCALVFCGDHGVVRQGVTQTDSSVTALVAKQRRLQILSSSSKTSPWMGGRTMTFSALSMNT